MPDLIKPDWDREKDLVYYEDKPKRRWRNWKLLINCFILDRHDWVYNIESPGMHCLKCNVPRI